MTGRERKYEDSILRFHGLWLMKGRFNAIAFYLDIAGMLWLSR